MRTGSGADWADGKNFEVDDLLNRVGCKIIIFSFTIDMIYTTQP